MNQDFEVENYNFRSNSASAHDLTTLLRECDAQFVPRLSQRVDLDSYATKLFNHAELFEAWAATAFVGVVAAYMNNESSRCGFISNVCVLPSHGGKGIATQLLAMCKQKMIDSGLGAVELEVSPNNFAAIRLYEKNGFQCIAKSNESWLMRCPLV